MINMMLTTNMSMDSLLPLLYTDDDKTPVVQNRCEEELDAMQTKLEDECFHSSIVLCFMFHVPHPPLYFHSLT